MSDEVAVIDSAARDTEMSSENGSIEDVETPKEILSQQLIEAPEQPIEKTTAATDGTSSSVSTLQESFAVEVQCESLTGENDDDIPKPEIPAKVEPQINANVEPETPEQMLERMEADDPPQEVKQAEKRGIKRKASIAFSDLCDDDFKGFGQVEPANVDMYNRFLERLQTEVDEATKNFVPLRTVMGMPEVKASKRARTDTDGSRPSSAMSSRSEDAGTDASSASSPGSRRRPTTEMSSPLLRVPLERGWRRELVYRAALDAQVRRHADIYYYTPQGKKVRSTREVAENLAGTGLTLENFSFFKEPLGIDDPDKEVIREAKLIRRVESPVFSQSPSVTPIVDGKRTPKPKAPKGASPEPATKSMPGKIKVKSVGSRLSGSGANTSMTGATKQHKKQQQQQQHTATGNNSDNNNSAAWKKPRPPGQTAPAAPVTGSVPGHAGHTACLPGQNAAAGQPSQNRALTLQSPPNAQGARHAVQPCSMACGRGTVPSLACAACLCLYHPACAGYVHSAPALPFLCKNCRKTSSPPSEPPPLIPKLGANVTPGVVSTPGPRRMPAPANVSAPLPTKVPKQDKRVLLRMKVAGSGAEGERVWSVSGPPRATPSIPQSIALMNGRKFIVVPRTTLNPPAQPQTHQHSITAADCN